MMITKELKQKNIGDLSLRRIINTAVETYVDPIDLPLVHRGAKVRVWFDGWPRIVFSGWPGLSYGTYGGKVVAIENFISANGKYRVLISPDGPDNKWPKELSIGAGAHLTHRLSLGYTYERVINEGAVNFGPTHEITLSFRLSSNTNKKTTRVFYLFLVEYI